MTPDAVRPAVPAARRLGTRSLAALGRALERGYLYLPAGPGGFARQETRDTLWRAWRGYCRRKPHPAVWAIDRGRTAWVTYWMPEGLEVPRPTFLAVLALMRAACYISREPLLFEGGVAGLTVRVRTADAEALAMAVLDRILEGVVIVGKGATA